MLELHAAGLNKLGYLTGQNARVEEGNSGYSKWCTEDAVVRGWLLKTMEPHLIGLFIDLSSAKKIWDSVTQTFYDGADESQFYELCCKATRTKQNGRPVNLYYAELNSVWQEIDKRQPIKMICAANLRTRQEEIQKDRIYDFLAGLDEVFDSIRSDLLRKKSVPSIEECFNTIRREAQRQVTMLGAKNTGEGSSIAMISKSTTPSNLRTLRAIKEAEKDKLRCSHCNGSRHTRDTCFEIHGYPDWFLEKQKQSKARSNKHPVQAKLTTATEIPSSFAAMAISQKDHTKPSELLSLAKTDQASATGKTGVVLSTSTVHDTGWIIDSGATNHVTYNKSLFQYMTPPSKEKVMTANGESTPVIGAGSIILTPNLSLHNCFPRFAYFRISGLKRSLDVVLRGRGYTM
jgi:hypothetical protein